MCDLLQSVFEIEECQKKDLLIYLRNKWRHFKNNLTKYYLAEDLTKHPPKIYLISLEPCSKSTGQQSLMTPPRWMLGISLWLIVQLKSLRYN